MKLKGFYWSLNLLADAKGRSATKTKQEKIMATYTCDGGSNPIPSGLTEGSPLSGSVEITSTGNCTIGNPIACTGNITITVTGGTLDTKALISTTGAIDVQTSNNDITVDGVIKAGSTLRMRAGLIAGTSAGAIEVKDDITTNLVQTGTGKGMMLLKAQGNIKTKSIKATGNVGASSVKTAGIQIDANMYGANNLFTIGANTSNGINGTIDTRTTTGGGTSASFIEGGVRITNGNASSTGGITVTSMSDILVQASDSKSGFIILNAQDGTLTLPAGTLNAAGASGKRAGVIHLLANTIQADDGTIISASQDSGVAGTMHQVIVAANDIKFKGTNGLEILANGDGASWNQRGSLYVLPKGGLTISSTGDAPNYSVTNLVWTASLPNFGSMNSEVNFDGTGTGSDTAPLTIKANGNFNQLFISGRPITFDGGEVTIQSRGSSPNSANFIFDNQLTLGYFGSYSDEDGLIFKGDGAVNIDANGVSGNAGQVAIKIEKASLNQNAEADTLVTVKAEGPASGNGNGGRIEFWAPYGVTLNAASKAIMSANGAPSAQGHGGYVEFKPGSSDITLGSENGEYQFAAKSGITGTSHGGEVKVNTFGDLTLDSASAANVSGQGTNGNGGKLTLEGAPIIFAGTGLTLNADGGSTSGNGGEIHILDHATSLSLDNVSNGLIMSAKAPASGNGGTIEVAYVGTLNVKEANINVDSAGDGKGGTIYLHDIDTLAFQDTGSTELNADGSGSGDGGTVWLKVTNTVTIGDGNSNVEMYARGNANSGTGSGGTITVEGPSTLNVNSAFLSVDAGGDGNGGGISLSEIGTLNFTGGSGDTLKADGAGSGNGGYISLVADNAITVDAGAGNVKLSARGDVNSGTGAGGAILVVSNTDEVVVDGAEMNVSAGDDNYGGSINIQGSEVTILSDITTNGAGTGDGGSIYIRSDSTLTIDDADFHADSGETEGYGGFIHLEGEEIILPGNKNTLVAANGTGTGNGGTTELITTGGAVDIGGGNGEVRIEAKGGDPSLSFAMSPQIANPHDSQSRRALTSFGGSIRIEQTDHFTVQSTDPLKVDAFGDGDGGAIVIQCSVSVNIDGAVTADGIGTGNGGTISIEAPTITLGSNATFSATAGQQEGSNGNGGTIALRNGAGSVKLDLTGYAEGSTALFSAYGRGSGEGGWVTIEKVTAFFIHSLISVDGGDSVNSTSVPFGTISLNGVICRQWRRDATNNEYPKTYWKSVVPNDSPDNTIATYAYGLDTDVKSLLDIRQYSSVQLYYMDNYGEYAFFDRTAVPTALGASLAQSIGISAVFARVDLGGGLQTVESATGISLIKKSVTAHELGHNLDFQAGNPSAATGTGTFNQAKVDDYNDNSAGHINYEPCATVLGSQVCGAFSGTNSQKFEAWQGGNSELFPVFFAAYTYPNTSEANLDNALTYLPRTKQWMVDFVAAL